MILVWKAARPKKLTKRFRKKKLTKGNQIKLTTV